MHVCQDIWASLYACFFHLCLAYTQSHTHTCEQTYACTYTCVYAHMYTHTPHWYVNRFSVCVLVQSWPCLSKRRLLPGEQVQLRETGYYVGIRRAHGGGQGGTPLWALDWPIQGCDVWIRCAKLPLGFPSLCHCFTLEIQKSEDVSTFSNYKLSQ